MVQGPSFLASGNIERSRFVKISGSHTVAACGAGDPAYGVSQRGVRETPLPGASTYAAISGDPLQVYGPGETCQLEAGAAVAAGAFLKSDASARGVTAASTENYYAQALTPAAAAGELIDVFIVRGVAP